jgi:hypothetical protein
METEHAEDTSLSNCGCEALPRRRCDLCPQERAFLACSRRCLDAHIEEAHPAHRGLDSAARSRLFFRDYNGRFPDTWDRYTAHRERLMALATSASPARTVGVFGAGNCCDVDLARLAAHFERIDLVDVDVRALERSYDRSSPEVRRKLTLHGDVDLSGMIDQLDAWGDDFPPAAELAKHALGAAHALVQHIGQAFDVTLSTCLLSQLPIPFQRTWVLRGASWANLIGAIRAVHLATLAGTTRPGGTAVLGFDVLSSAEAPFLAALGTSTQPELEATVSSEVARAGYKLHPDPFELARELASLSSLVRAPQVSSPWLWDLGDKTQLVYAITFFRA